MAGLPALNPRSGYRKISQVKFGGYDHNLGAEEGTIWDMENLCGDLYPVLSPRPRRTKVRTLATPNGIAAKDGLFWVDGTGFYFNGVKKGDVTDGKKTFCALGAYMVVFPDKVYYNTATDEFGSLEASWEGTASFQDGTYAGESAAGNSIVTTGSSFPFEVNEAIAISGSSQEGNNKTAIIREISEDRKTLRFYENSFTNASGQSLALKREVPDLDFLCENENRLWGCKGDTIRCCYLGNPFIWNNYDTVSTACFAADVGSSGDFTACVSYLGYPVFFKEENIYKVYGDKPSNFQVMGSASLGVEKGSGASLAVAGERLMYLSRAGIVVYSGGIPQSAYRAFGTEQYHNAVAGSDGRRYFVSMQDGDGAYSLFVYDTETNLWHREDAWEPVGFAWDGALYMLGADGDMWLDGRSRPVGEGTPEAAVESVVEFNDFYDESPDKKGLLKFQLRMELDEGASVKVSIRPDSGQWMGIASLAASRKKTYLIPIVPRRCDHFRVKLEGTGNWKLWSMSRKRYIGSELF